MADTSRTYLGPWINHKYGVIRGSTLTLSSRDGGLLLAFVALFVALAAGALWRMVAFVTHQVRAANVDRDGLHHQQQDVLRNTESPGKATWEFIQLLFYWRKRTDKAFVRSLSMVLLSLVCLAFIGAAGVLSARMVSGHGQDTLIISDNCGLWTSKTPSANDLSDLNLKLIQDTLAADAYNRECYGSSGVSSRCQQFYQKQLNFSTNLNASCPFSPEICSPNSTAVELDTGLLNSFDDFGWNTRKSQRVQWRKKTSCAILDRESYRTTVNVTAKGQQTDDSFQQYGQPGDTVDFWNYGVQFNDTNSTFWYNRHSVHDNIGYDLSVFYYNPFGGGKNAWIPLEALRREDADITIMFLNANSVRYSSPNSDPFFGANIYNYTIGPPGDQVTDWESNFNTMIMACTDQHQFCNPNNDQCTAFGDESLPYKRIGFNDVQLEIAGLLLVFLPWQSVAQIINGRAAAALRAQDYVDDLVSQHLPNNQWHGELEAWFATGLAKIQRSVLEFAAGSSNVTGNAYIQPPVDAIQKSLCYSQMVPSASDTINFSIASLSIVLLLSAFLIVTNLILDTVVGFIQRKLNARNPRRLQWIMSEKFQLRRLAFEGANMGDWSGGANGIPVTTTGEKFGAIPQDVDTQHPRYYRRKEEGEGASHEGEMLLGSSSDAQRKARPTTETYSVAES